MTAAETVRAKSILLDSSQQDSYCQGVEDGAARARSEGGLAPLLVGIVCGAGIVGAWWALWAALGA